MAGGHDDDGRIHLVQQRPVVEIRLRPAALGDLVDLGGEAIDHALSICADGDIGGVEHRFFHALDRQPERGTRGMPMAV